MDRPVAHCGTAALDLLRSADRIGLVLSGGSARCAFQIVSRFLMAGLAFFGN